MNFFFQPKVNALGRARIAGSHHRTIVYNHPFAVDDEVVGIRVYIELVIHLVLLIVVRPVNGYDVMDARHMHFVCIQYLLNPLLILVVADGDEYYRENN